MGLAWGSEREAGVGVAWARASEEFVMGIWMGVSWPGVALGPDSGSACRAAR